MIKKQQKPPKTHKICDFPGCTATGTHRAPKNRHLNDYFWFCLDHVREYNKNWNFFDGLNSDEIERHLQHDVTWQRPTWKLGQAGITAFPNFKDRFGIKTDLGLGMDGRYNPPATAFPEAQLILAAEFMELTPPIQLSDLKKQYKKLAKRYHPDTHPDDTSAAQNFQKLTESYQRLLKYLSR